MASNSIVMIVIIALITVTAILLAWRLRFQVLGFGVLVGSAYLLFISDVFLVIRVPTICIAGLGVLLAVFTFVPRSGTHKSKVKNTS